MDEVLHPFSTSRPVDEDADAFDVERAGRFVRAGVMEDDGHLICGDVGPVLAADEESNFVWKETVVSKCSM